jgi:hypothetical protein
VKPVIHSSGSPEPWRSQCSRTYVAQTYSPGPGPTGS